MEYLYINSHPSRLREHCRREVQNVSLGGGGRGCLSAVFWTCMDLVLVDSQHLASQDKTTTGSGQLIVYSGWVRGSCSPTLAEAMSIYWGRENLFVCVWVWPQEACPCSSGWLHHIHNYMKSTDWTQCDI